MGAACASKMVLTRRHILSKRDPRPTLLVTFQIRLINSSDLSVCLSLLLVSPTL
jgi:hypothetical protein